MLLRNPLQPESTNSRISWNEYVKYHFWGMNNILSYTTLVFFFLLLSLRWESCNPTSGKYIRFLFHVLNVCIMKPVKILYFSWYRLSTDTPYFPMGSCSNDHVQKQNGHNANLTGVSVQYFINSHVLNHKNKLQ